MFRLSSDNRKLIGTKTDSNCGGERGIQASFPSPTANDIRWRPALPAGKSPDADGVSRRKVEHLLYQKGTVFCAEHPSKTLSDFVSRSEDSLPFRRSDGISIFSRFRANGCLQLRELSAKVEQIPPTVTEVRRKSCRRFSDARRRTFQVSNTLVSYVAPSTSAGPVMSGFLDDPSSTGCYVEDTSNTHLHMNLWVYLWESIQPCGRFLPSCRYSEVDRDLDRFCYEADDESELIWKPAQKSWVEQ